MLNEPDKKVINVTSTVTQEGKTFFSMNLALSFALTNKKVILVGLDIRRPQLKKHFSIIYQVFFQQTTDVFFPEYYFVADGSVGYYAAGAIILQGSFGYA